MFLGLGVVDIWLDNSDPRVDHVYVWREDRELFVRIWRYRLIVTWKGCWRR